MAKISIEKGFKAFEWGIVIALLICSYYFFWSVMWSKFQDKKTSISTYQEVRTEMPTTVLCFAPFGKPSVLTKYNMTIKNLVYSNFPENLLNNSWTEFSNETFYILNKDFYLYTSSNNSWQKLTEGENNETHIMTIEKLQTIWSGLCYKMTYRNFSLDKPNFLLKFDSSLASEDIPLAEIYLTSEDNAYGILGYSWNNGVELKLQVEGYDQDFKIYASKKNSLNVTYNEDRRVLSGSSTKTCSKYLYHKCEMEAILTYEYSDCENRTCLAMTLPPSSNADINKFPDCQSIRDYVCMKNEMNVIMGDVNEKCPKHCSATQYAGKRTFVLHSNENTKYDVNWFYVFASKEIEVNQEYLLYEITDIISNVGGILGLFIGFSFRDVIGCIIEYIKCYVIKKLDTGAKRMPKKSRMPLSSALSRVEPL